MLRVSVTTLEKFRRYIRETTPDDTEERLIESIAGSFVGNDYTRIGHSFHHILERGFDKVIKDGSRFYCKGCYFSEAQLRLAIRYHKDYLFMVREVPTFKIYQVPNLGEVMITCRIDGIEGREIRDTKLKFSPVRVDQFVDSYQWRAYLDILDLDNFYFDPFYIEGYDPEKHGRDISSLTMTREDPIPCSRYDELTSEVHGLVIDFFQYIEAKQFFHLLKTANLHEKNYLF